MQEKVSEKSLPLLAGCWTEMQIQPKRTSVGTEAVKTPLPELIIPLHPQLHRSRTNTFAHGNILVWGSQIQICNCADLKRPSVSQIPLEVPYDTPVEVYTKDTHLFYRMRPLVRSEPRHAASPVSRDVSLLDPNGKISFSSKGVTQRYRSITFILWELLHWGWEKLRSTKTGMKISVVERFSHLVEGWGSRLPLHLWPNK